MLARSRKERRLASKLQPAFELAHGELPDQLHAGFAVVETRNDCEVFSAMAPEHAGIFDGDLFQRLKAIGRKSRRDHGQIRDASLS
jgi:hypothetical protein